MPINVVEHIYGEQSIMLFEHIPGRLVAGSCDRLIFSFVRILYTDFHSSCTNLHSHQQWKKVPLSPHPHQHSLPVILWILAILTSVRRNLKVLFIFISLIARKDKYFLRCFFLAISIPYIKTSQPFLNWILFVGLHFIFFVCLLVGWLAGWLVFLFCDILYISPLSCAWLTKILSHSVSLIFTQMIIFLVYGNFLWF